MLIGMALMLFSAYSALAQCPMCKAAAESSIKEGQTTAFGLNDGILYLLSFPYLLVISIGLFWYFKLRKARTAGQA